MRLAVAESQKAMLWLGCPVVVGKAQSTTPRVGR